MELYSCVMNSRNVGKFYDDFGWVEIGSHTYDALINENLEEIAQPYIRNVRLRIKRNLGTGKSVLDVGSGPIQYPEYEAYSDNFEIRVCVDMSQRALDLARNRIGVKGVFYRGDFLTLPRLSEAPFDGAALVNVLYHVQKDSQQALVEKILQELNPGAKLVVVYSNPNSFSSTLTKWLLKLKRLLQKLHLIRKPRFSENPIYFYRHPIQFWDNFSGLANVQVKAWRTLDPSLETLISKNYFFARVLLNLFFRLEEREFWAKIAEYQLVILEKR
jgi:SAM-dependent methyltransferase